MLFTATADSPRISPSLSASPFDVVPYCSSGALSLHPFDWSLRKPFRFPDRSVSPSLSESPFFTESSSMSGDQAAASGVGSWGRGGGERTCATDSSYAIYTRRRYMGLIHRPIGLGCAAVHSKYVLVEEGETMRPMTLMPHCLIADAVHVQHTAYAQPSPQPFSRVKHHLGTLCLGAPVKIIDQLESNESRL